MRGRSGDEAVDEAVDEAIQTARQFQADGRLADAERIYLAVLDKDPNCARAWRSLGSVRVETDRMEAAVIAFNKAIALEPDDAEAHDGIGVALMETGQSDAAIAAWRRVVTLRPDDADAHQNLALGLRHLGRLDEAIAVWRGAVALQPGDAERQVGLGNLLRESGRLDEANAAYGAAAGLCAEPGGDLAGAATAPFDAATAAKQGAINAAAAVAVSAFAQATALDPALADRHNGMGSGLLECGSVDEAIVILQTAMRMRPDLAATHNNLGIALREAGRLEEAIASYDHAIALDPDHVVAHDNRLFALHGHPGYDAAALLTEHRHWNQRFARPLPREPHPRPGAEDRVEDGVEDRAPARRLRIGYVSPDFREHPVGYFLLPLFEAHDRGHFDVIGYSDVRAPDAITRRLADQVTTWRDTAGVSDAALAARIRDDRIDILVDLAMHSADNRLRVFARKPAPVQVTYLAYCSTTGLDTIDWRLTDPFLDPPGLAAETVDTADTDTAYVERSMRLPHSYWCYQPRSEADGPAVGPLPALDTGRTTFGCLNDFGKIGRPLLETWCRILTMIPRSQLVLQAPRGTPREGVRDVVARAGLDPGCLQFVNRVPLPEYLAAYGRIDVALDPFPYGGGRTTCDALWMGVPVVSLSGRTAVGRGGVSILSNLGLTELVAKTADEYVEIAARLANDLPQLDRLRRGLRARMQRSPLMDRSGFARAMESAYRQMWRAYCGGG